MSQGETCLSTRDIRFIRLLVPDRADEVMRAYEVRPPHWSRIVSGGTSTSLLRDALLYLRLVGRVAASCLRREQDDGAGVTCCEYAVGHEARRDAFFGHFLPGVRIRHVTSATRLACAPRGVRTPRLLLGLLPLLLSRADRASGAFGGRYVHTMEYCLAAVAHSFATSRREAYLLRMYHPHTPLLSAFLMSHGVSAHLITSTGRLVSAELAIPADSMKLTHPCQAYAAVQYATSRAVSRLDMWGPIELVEMAETYAGVGRDGPNHVLGAYTQGYWLRVKSGFIAGEIAQRSTHVEAEFMDALAEYISTRPGVRILVFAHPMERRHYSATGELGPWELVKDPRVEVMAELGEPSNEYFHRAGVGLTTFSTIGYDRLYMGFRTLFYRGDIRLEDDDVVSPFSQLFLRDRDAFFVAIDSARSMSASEFENRHFGGPLRAWTPDPEMAREMAEFSARGFHAPTCWDGRA